MSISWIICNIIGFLIFLLTMRRCKQQYSSQTYRKLCLFYVPIVLLLYGLVVIIAVQDHLP